MNLIERKCVPCEGNVPPLTEAQIQQLLPEIPTWNAVENKKLEREYTFPNFVRAMAFVDAIADIAETEGHHPDIHIFYNKVKLEIWTHAINGLSENDFILAAKIASIVKFHMGS